MLEFTELPTGFNDTPTIPQRYPKNAIVCPDPRICPPVALEKVQGNSSTPDDMLYVENPDMRLYWKTIGDVITYPGRHTTTII